LCPAARETAAADPLLTDKLVDATMQGSLQATEVRPRTLPRRDLVALGVKIPNS